MQKAWIQRLMNSFGKYQQFMKGRYGSFDQINKTLLAISLIAFILKRWVDGRIIIVIMVVSLGLLVYRFFSKKIYVRSNENQRILHLFDRQKQRPKVKKSRKKAQKQNNTAVQYVIFSCENCGQSLRAPQGKGKIKVTCQKCHHTFIKEV